MGAGRILVNLLVVLAAIAGGFYQITLRPILTRLGQGRVVESINNNDCTGVPELKACEKLVLHQASGLVYLACSTPESRVHWLPATRHLNAVGAKRDDYVAIYDPKTQKVTKLTFEGFPSARGFSSHGMDVVTSSDDPNQLWLYLINHRAPLEGDATKIGADSSIEIFKGTLGGSTLDYIQTVEDPETIITPNDLIGSPDGKSFYVTNDHGSKTGWKRELETFGYAATSVTYCNVDEGCKFAIQNMHSNNGIAQAPNGTVYVVSCIGATLSVLEKQADNTLFVTDIIKSELPLDNIQIDSEGHVWAAAFPKGFDLLKHFTDPTGVKSATSVVRFSINTGPGSFYGEKYRIEKVFEDNGDIASGTTTVAYDTERNLLFLTGLASPQLTVCKI
ncbi:calcium-dependent phosphotriesterase [Coprinopsis marcescibilis]|uniref:Calcium-dependent phosphotriesterase n=1 Tax=Coprinopsis marcescibilis TaxID=230819 RepID=A0A5C3KX56_COPMA|nr:calcium-dependent phosphotriesterase [Coprinopsis marcescibilis]